jgi:ectoine hydroxylase-related dioxygenase (phytanoyl-CoA dioxygenase family)
MTLKEEYERNGVVGPIQILTLEELSPLREEMLASDRELNLMKSDYRCKSNVLFPWIDKISKNPKLKSLVSELIGPNFHCWDTLLWFKMPHDGRDVGFHQDATYWNFTNRHRAVTAWFTFDDAGPEQGSVEYIVGSHRELLLRHKDVKTPTNLLMRGQTVDVEIPKTRLATNVTAGSVMLHSPFVIHGSSSNKTDHPRYAMGMIFVSTECKPHLDISPESTVMISGVDEYNYMLHDPSPTGNWTNDVNNWKLAYDRQHDNYYKMEQRNVL